LSFLATILTGHWQHAGEFRDYLTSVAELIVGGRCCGAAGGMDGQGIAGKDAPAVCLHHSRRQTSASPDGQLRAPAPAKAKLTTRHPEITRSTTAISKHGGQQRACL
jgi:hypothetical protein